MNLAGWTSRPRPGTKTLHGLLVRLEPLEWQRHGERLFAAVGGSENAGIWRYMPTGPFADYAAFRSRLQQSGSEQQWETMVICAAAGNDVLGMASYMRIREAHGSVEVGCVAFSPRLQRTTSATEALALMATHVFDELGYRRFEWKCHNANLASKRCAERFGFTFEGVFRNDMVTKGESRDTAWYSIIDTEWPAIRKALDEWLSPVNFDAAGSQKQTLETLRTTRRPIPTRS